MNNRLRISIPSPCHENWRDMTPVEKGRFCASCQKVVHDFTRSSDKEIAEIYLKDNTACGRFLNTQLNRRLTIPASKKSVWFTASTAILSFIALGNQEVYSQAQLVTEQFEKEIKPDKDNYIERALISRTIIDEISIPTPGANIFNKNTGIHVQADFDGRFFIEACPGDVLECSFIGHKTKLITVGESPKILITLGEVQSITMGIFIEYKKPTFFGRVFSKIGNLFRKNE